MTHGKKYNTLVRIESADEDIVRIVVPAWDPSEVIEVRTGEFASFLHLMIKDNLKRFHAKVDLGAHTKEDLIASATDWHSIHMVDTNKFSEDNANE